MKGTSTKITSQKVGFLNLFKPLVRWLQLSTAGLPLVKNVVTLSARSVLILSGLKAAASP